MLDHARTSFGAPGAIALVRDGSDEWLGVSGSADVDGTPLTGDARFRIGSITKPIVAALILDSVDRGDLSLDDKVADLLPGVIRPEPPITLRMLLDHTSGIFNVGDEGDIVADIEALTDPALRAEAKDLVERYLDGERVIVPDRLFVAVAQTHDPYFAPGVGYHYSNVNYQLAGMVAGAGHRLVAGRAREDEDRGTTRAPAYKRGSARCELSRDAQLQRRLSQRCRWSI